MSSEDALTVRERFELARVAAVASTDRYRNLRPEDPERPAAWARAMRLTERARQLLEAWLDDADDADEALAEPTRTLSLGRG